MEYGVEPNKQNRKPHTRHEYLLYGIKFLGMDRCLTQRARLYKKDLGTILNSREQGALSYYLIPLTGDDPLPRTLELSAADRVGYTSMLLSSNRMNSACLPSDSHYIVHLTSKKMYIEWKRWERKERKKKHGPCSIIVASFDMLIIPF